MKAITQSSESSFYEKDIETDILNLLASDKRVFAWKVNSVGVYDPTVKRYRKPNSPFIIKGVSDILGITNTGKMFAIEVKRPRGSKRSREQIAFVDKINRMGGSACFATSLDQVKKFLTEMLG